MTVWSFREPRYIAYWLFGLVPFALFPVALAKVAWEALPLHALIAMAGVVALRSLERALVRRTTRTIAWVPTAATSLPEGVVVVPGRDETAQVVTVGADSRTGVAQSGVPAEGAPVPDTRFLVGPGWPARILVAVALEGVVVVALHERWVTIAGLLRVPDAQSLWGFAAPWLLVGVIAATQLMYSTLGIGPGGIQLHGRVVRWSEVRAVRSEGHWLVVQPVTGPVLRARLVSRSGLGPMAAVVAAIIAKGPSGWARGSSIVRDDAFTIATTGFGLRRPGPPALLLCAGPPLLALACFAWLGMYVRDEIRIVAILFTLILECCVPLVAAYCLRAFLRGSADHRTGPWWVSRGDDVGVALSDGTMVRISEPRETSWIARRLRMGQSSIVRLRGTIAFQSIPRTPARAVGWAAIGVWIIALFVIVEIDIELVFLAFNWLGLVAAITLTVLPLTLVFRGRLQITQGGIVLGRRELAFSDIASASSRGALLTVVTKAGRTHRWSLVSYGYPRETASIAAEAIQLELGLRR